MARKSINKIITKEQQEKLLKKEKKQVDQKEVKKFKGRVKQGDIGRNPKGSPQNLRPRKKGEVNKVTKDIKQAFKKLVEDNIDNMEKWLNRVAVNNPEKALRILIDLSPYIVPKLATTELKVEHTQQYDLTKLTDSELGELIKLSEKATLININNNQLINDIEIIDIKNNE